MTNALKSRWNAFWGRGEHSVTVPPMDGNLRPNMALDRVPPFVTAEAPDNCATHDGRLWFTQAGQLRSVGRKGDLADEGSFDADISALAIDPGGTRAVALDDGRILLSSGPRIDLQLPGGAATALHFTRTGDLLIAVGSVTLPASAWRRDLMRLGGDGAVFRVPAGGVKPEKVASGLRFPSGVTSTPDGAIIVTEAWGHRLVRLGTGKPVAVLSDLPGYPGRLSPDPSGGYWLAIFAPRSQMIEFVLRESGYRTRMIATVPEEFWMAPALRSGQSFKEPLQGGGVKHLGIHKPWGPTRSYGLVVRLDAEFLPVSSFHSRSSGTRHGITSAAVWDDRVALSVKGDGMICLLDPGMEGIE